MAKRRVALFLDFDGTLVEIARGPDAIDVPRDLGGKLEQLDGRLGGSVALVTGRDAANLTDFLGPASLHIAGSHGGHIMAPGGAILREAEALPDDVRRKLKAFSDTHDLLYERKAHGAALHYRARPELEDTAIAFARELAVHHGLCTKSGKCVIEVVQPNVDKGGAVALLAQQPAFDQALPIFVGDDVTDEDGFAACEKLGGFGIVVGDRVETKAQYRLPTVREVYRWLSL